MSLDPLNTTLPFLAIFLSLEDAQRVQRLELLEHQGVRHAAVLSPAGGSSPLLLRFVYQGTPKRQPTSMGEGEADVWRDSLVRYLGYANELGESFRPLAPRLVAPSYFVALAYVAGDTLDKAHRAREKFEAASERRRAAEVANAAGDTLLWQTSVRSAGSWLGAMTCWLTLEPRRAW